MADGISAVLSDDLLALAFLGTSYAGNAQVWVQLHTGAPGSAGTSNVAGESARQSPGSGAWGAPSAGSISNTAAINWTSVTTSETYTHVSIWSASTSGVFLASGAITANPVVTGDNFQIPIGDITISQTVAS